MIDQHRRHVGRRRGDDDAVKGSLFRPAQRAVADDGGDVGQFQAAEAFLGLFQQFRKAFDGIEAAAQRRQHGSLITGAGADLQHLHALAHLQRLGHQADHLRLADGLVLADGQGLVFVGLVAEGFGHEQFAGQLFHGRQHPSIADAAAAQVEDQPYFP